MKTKMLLSLSLAVLTLGFVGGAHAKGAVTAKLESKSGKELSCRAKIKFKNTLDQTVQIDDLRIASASDKGFFTEYTLGGSRYRPVSGATLSTPMLEVKVPNGHKLTTEITYRTQKTAGKNPKFSAPKTAKWGAGAIQPACSLSGQTLTVTIN